MLGATCEATVPGRLALALVCLSISIFLCSAQAAWGGALILDCAYLRIPENSDTATAYLFLKNADDRSILIERLELDGQRIPITNAPPEVQADYERERAATAIASETNWGKLDRLTMASESVWWSKVEPNPVPAGGIGAVSIKRRSRPLRPFRIGVFGRGANDVREPSQPLAVSTVFHPRGQALQIEAVGFEAAGEKGGGPSFERLFLYVYVPGDQPANLAPADVWVDGRNVTGNSAFLPLPIVPTPGEERQEWVGRRWLVACRLDPPVARGQAMVVKTAARPSAGGKPGAATAIRVRAFSEFAVRTESGRQSPPGPFLDPVPASDPDDTKGRSGARPVPATGVPHPPARSRLWSLRQGDRGEGRGAPCSGAVQPALDPPVPGQADRRSRGVRRALRRGSGERWGLPTRPERLSGRKGREQPVPCSRRGRPAGAALQRAPCPRDAGGGGGRRDCSGRDPGGMVREGEPAMRRPGAVTPLHICGRVRRCARDLVSKPGLVGP